MNEREMLEAAARAVGMKAEIIQRIEEYWNPRIDEFDAFHLAAALRISVEHNDPMDRRPWVSASIPVPGLAFFRFMEDVPDESQRADRMRLAILRCAAAQAPKEANHAA